MSRQKRRHHYKEQKGCDGDDHEQVRIQAYKGVYKQERIGMRRLLPTEQAFQLILKGEHNSDSVGDLSLHSFSFHADRTTLPGIEAAEIVGHQR